MSGLNHQITLSADNRMVGTGWLAPRPDLRDYTAGHSDVKPMVQKLKFSPHQGLPAKTDLREWCSPVEDQRNIGSCTAQAGVGVMEYYQKRAFGKHLEGSRLFVYKTTRNLMGVTGDTGAWLRNTMAALVLCGLPAEKYWLYNTKKYDDEPPAFLYAIADDYKAVKYFRHDSLGISGADALDSVKQFLASGIPSMFGFYGFGSFEYSDRAGAIPFPCPGEQAEWGHAIVAVGYDDAMKIRNTRCNKESKGALLIRNSWGTGWGDKGYGWLPYEYVIKGLAMDFWSMLKMEWVDTKNFGI